MSNGASPAGDPKAMLAKKLIEKLSTIGKSAGPKSPATSNAPPKPEKKGMTPAEQQANLANVQFNRMAPSLNKKLSQAATSVPEDVKERKSRLEEAKRDISKPTTHANVEKGKATEGPSTTEKIGNWIHAPIDYTDRSLKSIMNPGDMVDAGEERMKNDSRWQRTLGRLQATAGHGLQALQEEDPMKGFGHLSRMAGTLGGGIPVIGKAIEGIGKLGQTAFEAIDRIGKWGEALHETNMRFSEFSASIAGVRARDELRAIQRQVTRGERQAEVAERLAQANDRSQRAWSPSIDLWERAKQEIAIVLQDYIKAPIGRGLDKILQRMGLIEDHLRPNNPLSDLEEGTIPGWGARRAHEAGFRSPWEPNP